jgi:hypothetical protein
MSEMDKFPAGKDNGLDAASYIYDIIKTYPFTDAEGIEVNGMVSGEDSMKSKWDRAFNKARGAVSGGWISV